MPSPTTLSQLTQRPQRVPMADGTLAPVPNQRLTPTEIVGMLNDALLSKYTGKDPTKINMSKGAAAFMALAEQAQDGDQAAFSMLLDRLVGKPTQQINALTLTANLSDFLSSLAGEMEKEVIDVEDISDAAQEVDPFGD